MDCWSAVPIGRPKLKVATWLELTAEAATRFCQRSVTPGWRASNEAIS